MAQDTAQSSDPPHSSRAGAVPPLSRAGKLAWLLDNQFQVPGTTIRVGLDGILGIIPGVGDTISTGLSLLILAEAVQCRVSRKTIAAMMGNIAIDWVVGLVPLVGDVFDILYKANMRNLTLLERDLAVQRSGEREGKPVRQVANEANGVNAAGAG